MKLQYLLPTNLRKNPFFVLAYDSWRYWRANFLGCLLAGVTLFWLLGAGLISQVADLFAAPSLTTMASGPAAKPYQLSYLVHNHSLAVLVKDPETTPLAAQASLTVVAPSGHREGPVTYTPAPVASWAAVPSVPAPQNNAASTPVTEQTQPPKPTRVYVIQPKVLPAPPRVAFSYGPATPVAEAAPPAAVSAPSTPTAVIESGEVRARRAKALISHSSMNH